MRVGPNRLDGPAPGPLLVISGKLSGATPGFIVQDMAGVEFVVKLDPPAQPELSSGAEVIATKLLWAAGYNVPENYMARLYFERLRLAPDATTPGKYGVSVPMTEERLVAIVTNANPTPDGSVRAIFSRLIPGRHIGPFSYRGTRSGDPNDRIPHQARRSLRGLWVISAWLNDAGIGAGNTLDTFGAAPTVGRPWRSICGWSGNGWCRSGSGARSSRSRGIAVDVLRHRLDGFDQLGDGSSSVRSSSSSQRV